MFWKQNTFCKEGITMTKRNASGIWVLAEQTDGILSPVVLELLAKAQELKLASPQEETVTAVLLGDQVESLASVLVAHGADNVLLAEHPLLAQYKPRTYKQVLVELARSHAPSIFLIPSTPLGRDLAPRVMCALGTGLTADAIDLGFDADGMFVHTTPGYGGTVLVDIAIPEQRPQMVTVRPMVFSPLAPDPTRSGDVIRETVSLTDDESYVIVDTVDKTGETDSLPEAKVVIAGGRGIKSEEDLNLLHQLAELLGGQLGCSRPLCENGWMSHDTQIGQSGVTVKPNFILNVGVSGAGQYVSGMDQSSCCMSINYTDGAPIFGVSHYGVVADYRTILPALLKELRKRKQ